MSEMRCGATARRKRELSPVRVPAGTARGTRHKASGIQGFGLPPPT